MAKSVGNICLLHGALDEYGREALIMYLVGGHYRQPIAFSAEALEEAGRAAERIRELGRRFDPEGGAPRARCRGRALLRRARRRLQHPGRAGVLFDWVAEANRRLDAGERLGAGRLGEMLHALGLESLLEAGAEDGRRARGRAARRRARGGPRRRATSSRRPLRDELAAPGLGGPRHARRRPARAPR